MPLMRSIRAETDLAACGENRYHPASLSDKPFHMLTRPWATGNPIGRRGRIALLLLGACLIAGFGLACSLEPDPRGFGTHERLGFPPCTIQVSFGLPCPSCGMTTSFSNFVRGRVVEAAEANLAGLLLAAICAIGVPWSMWSAYCGRLWLVTRPTIVALWLMTVICVVGLLQWLVRMATAA